MTGGVLVFDAFIISPSSFRFFAFSTFIIMFIIFLSRTLEEDWVWEQAPEVQGIALPENHENHMCIVLKCIL